MSLILEALRKSEAERQRGRAPDLHTALGTPRATRDAHRGWVVGILVVVAGVAVAGWLWRDLLLPGSTHPAAATASPPTHPAPPVTTAAPLQPAPATPPAPPRTTPGDVARRAPMADDPARPTPPDAFTGAIAAAATPPPAPALAASQDPSPTPIPQETERLRGLGDLDSNTRAQLPALKVSMHVWNDDPAQRFALIDGQRLGEGAQIGDALVERIDRDGVVLSWRGERLRLPRP